MAARIYRYWTTVCEARWSGGRILDGGVFYGTGVPVGRNKREAEANMRRGVDMAGRPLPTRDLQIVDSPWGVEYLWDPEERELVRVRDVEYPWDPREHRLV